MKEKVSDADRPHFFPDREKLDACKKVSPQAQKAGAVSDAHYHIYRLWVSARVAHCFRERDYFPGQVIEEEQPDGSLVVSYEGPGLEVMRSFVMSWGRDVWALEPPELVSRIREELQALEAHYEEAHSPQPS